MPPPETSTPIAPPQTDGRVDGRHARRQRNRDAVVEALLGFYREGVLQPSTDQIAERAGISARSLFRYFDDVDDLCRVAISHQIERIGSRFFVDIDPGLELPDRVASFVQQRLDLYEAMGWVGVVARSREWFQPLVADELARARALFREQLRSAFAAELEPLDEAERARRVAGSDVFCSFEAYRLLLDDQRLDREQITAVLTDGLVRQLGT